MLVGCTSINISSLFTSNFPHCMSQHLSVLCKCSCMQSCALQRIPQSADVQKESQVHETADGLLLMKKKMFLQRWQDLSRIRGDGVSVKVWQLVRESLWRKGGEGEKEKGGRRRCWIGQIDETGWDSRDRLSAGPVCLKSNFMEKIWSFLTRLSLVCDNMWFNLTF